MIQQLRPQFASLTPSAKATEDPTFVSDFTDWMADESKDASDQEVSVPGTAALFSVLPPVPSQAEPGAGLPVSVSTDTQGLAASGVFLRTAATDRDQLDLHGQIQPELSEDATAAQLSRAPPESCAQNDAALSDNLLKPQSTAQNIGKAADLSEFPGSSPLVDGAEVGAKQVSRQASDSILILRDNTPSLQSGFTQDQPPKLHASAATPNFRQPIIEAAEQVQQGNLLAPMRFEGTAPQPWQTQAKSALQLGSAGSPLSTSPAMPVTVQFLAAGPPEPENLPAPQPALRSPRVELSNTGQGDEDADTDIAAQRPEGLPSLSPQRPTDLAAESQRQHLTAPPNLHGQLLQHAPAAIDRQVEVLLTPEELGSVKFQIRHHGDTVSILLSAERTDTMDMLRRHGDELMREFRQAGFSGATLDFGRWGQQQQSQRQTPASFALAEDFAALPPMPRPNSAAQAPGVEQGLNLRL